MKGLRNFLFLLLITAVAIPANGAISKVQNAVYAGYAGTPVTASFPNTPTSGNLMIALGYGSTVYTNASISGWTQIISASYGYNKDISLFYKIAGASESKDVTMAWTSSTGTYLLIEEWTGLDATPLDKSAGENYTGNQLYKSSGTTATTTADNELCIAGFGALQAIYTLQWTNSFVNEGHEPTYDLLNLCSRIVSATGAYETTQSWATQNSYGGGVIATFKAASATTPTVTTTAISSIAGTTATGGGNVTSNGGSAVTDRGVCWNTTGTPTISDSHTHDSSGDGAYVSSLTGLTARTTYHVRAWATNAIGTSYGAEVDFNTTGAALTFYVDYTTGDDGDTGLTEALAWKTISKVNSAVLEPDDFIKFKCGEVWYEMLIPSANGTSGHQITFASYSTGAKPIISGASAGTPTVPVRDQCVQIGDSGYVATRQYLTFDGLEFAYPVKYGLAQIMNADAPGIIVQNCTFTKCGLLLEGASTIIQDNTFVGPAPAGALDDDAVTIMQTTATNVQVLGNTISGYTSRGVWFTAGPVTPTANDNIISGISGVTGYGINFDGAGTPITGTVTALGNNISTCGSVGIFLENCSDGSLVSRNLVHDCTSYAEWHKNYTTARGDNVGAKSTFNIYYNNPTGVFLEDVSGVDIWNNAMAGKGTASAIVLNGATAYFTDIDIRNNAFIGSTFSAIVEVPDADWTNNLAAFDYNAVGVPYVGSCIIYESATPTILTLANLQGASQALHCFATAPGFVNAAAYDFRLLLNSPCRSKGTNVSLTTDYAGNTVPAWTGKAPDIGAYEMRPTGVIWGPRPRPTIH